MAARLFPTAAKFIESGLVGTVGYTITDTAGAILAARTTAGITESPAGTGKYIALAALDSSWSGWIDWDDGGSGTLSERFEGTTLPTGTVAPQPRRPFQFVHRLGSPSVLTDAASVVMSDPTNTFGARDLATGVIVVPNNTPMTRVALGSYFWDVVEPGGNIEWYAKVTETALNGGGTFAYPFTSLDPTATTHYATRADIEAEIGVDNAAVYADLNSNKDATEIAARFEDVLAFADEIINAELGMNSYTVPLVAVAGGSIPTWLTATLRTIAAKLASWQLGQGRDHTQVNPDAARKDLQNRYDWAMSRLEMLILSGLEGVVVGEPDPQYTVAAPVAAGPTVDANGCPLPPVYCGYPYGHRYYRGVCN